MMIHFIRPQMARVFAGGVLMLMCSGVWAETATTVTLNATQGRALGIETLTLSAATAARLPRLPARVQIPNDQMRIITAPTGGLITQLRVAPGDRVQRGQVVALLSSPQALELQRDARQSASQSGLLEHNLRRDEQLYAEGLIPESRLQATRAASAQARAQVQERRASLRLSGMSLEGNEVEVTLRAPMDGVVLEQGAQTGQHVEATTSIYKIARLSPLWLDIQAPAELAATLAPGVVIQVAGFPDDILKARLMATGRQVDAASQTVLLRALVSQGAERLMPGQLVEAMLSLSLSPGAGNGNDKAAASKNEQMTLPAQALIHHEGNTYVFVQKEATKFEARIVKMMQQGQDSIQVSGVHAGERVAIKGVSALKALLAGVGKE